MLTTRMTGTKISIGGGVDDVDDDRPQETTEEEEGKHTTRYDTIQHQVSCGVVWCRVMGWVFVLELSFLSFFLSGYYH